MKTFVPMQEAHLRKLWSHDLSHWEWPHIHSWTPFAGGMAFEKNCSVLGCRESSALILYDNGDLATFVNCSLFGVCEEKPVLKKCGAEGRDVATVAKDSLELMYADGTPIYISPSNLPASTKCIASMAGRLLLVHGKTCYLYDMITVCDKNVTMQLVRIVEHGPASCRKIRGYSTRDFFVTIQDDVYRVWDRDTMKVFEISFSGFHRFVGVANGFLYVNSSKEIKRFDIGVVRGACNPFGRFPPFSIGMDTLYPGVAVFTTLATLPAFTYIWDGYRAERTQGIKADPIWTRVYTYEQRIYVWSCNTLSCYLREVPSLANLCTEHLGDDLVARLDKLPIELRERVDSLRHAIAVENGVIWVIN